MEMRDLEVTCKMNYSVICYEINIYWLRLGSSVIHNNAKEMTPTY